MEKIRITHLSNMSYMENLNPSGAFTGLALWLVQRLDIIICYLYAHGSALNAFKDL